MLWAQQLQQIKYENEMNKEKLSIESNQNQTKLN